MDPTYFPKPEDWRKWLHQHHAAFTEFLVGFHKKESGKPSITWPESVDGALCYGWIDGVRRRIDDTSYCIRFTPRKPSSNWSLVNIQRVSELTAAGLMHPAGLRAFEKRQPERSGIYAFEQRHVEFGEVEAALFKGHPQAWDFFQAQPAGYRRLVTWRVVSAKREDTRQKRLAELVAACAAARRLT